MKKLFFLLLIMIGFSFQTNAQDQTTDSLFVIQETGPNGEKYFRTGNIRTDIRVDSFEYLRRLRISSENDQLRYAQATIAWMFRNKQTHGIVNNLVQQVSGQTIAQIQRANSQLAVQLSGNWRAILPGIDTIFIRMDPTNSVAREIPNRNSTDDDVIPGGKRVTFTPFSSISFRLSGSGGNPLITGNPIDFYFIRDIVDEDTGQVRLKLYMDETKTYRIVKYE